MENEKSIVDNYISKGDTKNAIKYLLQVIDSKSSHYSSIVNLSSRFNRLSKEKQNGVLDDDYYNREINKINLSLVSFGEEQIDTPNKGKSKVFGKSTIGLLFITFLGIGFWIINSNNNNSNTNDFIPNNSTEVLGSKSIEPEVISSNTVPLTIDYYVGTYTGGNLTIGNNTDNIVLIKNLKVMWDYEECPSYEPPKTGAPMVIYKYEIDITKEKGEKIIDKREFKYSKGEIEKFNIDINYPGTGVYTIWVAFEFKIFGSDTWKDFKSQKDVIEKCVKW